MHIEFRETLLPCFEVRVCELFLFRNLLHKSIPINVPTSGAGVATGYEPAKITFCLLTAQLLRQELSPENSLSSPSLLRVHRRKDDSFHLRILTWELCSWSPRGSARAPFGSRITLPLLLLTTYRQMAFAILLFLLTSSDLTQRSKQIGGICTLHLPERLTTHNITHSQLWLLSFCNYIAQFWGNISPLRSSNSQIVGIGAGNSMHLCFRNYFYFITSLFIIFSEKFALCNSYSHSHAPIVSEKTTEQKQDIADSRIWDNNFFYAVALALLFLGLLPICICNFQYYGNYLFYAAAVLEIFKINFAIFFFWGGGRYMHTHTHQLHNFNCWGNNLCNACVSLVFVCLASMISMKDKYTAITFGELISNCTHTSYTTVMVGELIV